MDKDRLLVNLRAACATRKSVSEICRDLEINRQQFNRYINGSSLPSAYNMTKIANYFGLNVQDFQLPPSHFHTKIYQPASNKISDMEKFLGAFPGDMTALQRYIGSYQTYHLSPSWPGAVVCSFARIYEQNGRIMLKSVERINDPSAEIHQYSKYIGMVSYSRDRLFCIERSVTAPSMLSETILLPYEIHQRRYLKGMTFGVSWRNNNLPYASRSIWRSLGQITKWRSALAKCNQLPLGSSLIPETVQNYLSEPEPFGISRAVSL